MDMARALDRLRGRGSNRMAHPGDQPPLADLRSAVAEQGLAASVGERALRKLVAIGHTLSWTRVSTVMLGDFLKTQERVTTPSISRYTAGVSKGVLTAYGKVF